MKKQGTIKNKKTIICENGDEFKFKPTDILDPSLKAGSSVEFDTVEFDSNETVAKPKAQNIRGIVKKKSPPRAEKIDLKEMHTPIELIDKNLSVSDSLVPPYNFIPVETNHGQTDSPVWHNGKNIEQESLLSGELHCTLTSLTPLLVANQHYTAKDVIGGNEEGVKIRLPNDWGIGDLVDKDKNILEPLRLKTGEVLIPGSGLKGMIRQSISSLLAAPMEHVTEQSYSYRPSSGGYNKSYKLKTKPAIIEKIDATGIHIAYPKDDNYEVVFINEAANNTLSRKYKTGSLIKKGESLKDLEKKFKASHIKTASKLYPARNKYFEVEKEYLYCQYDFGIDGKGKLSKVGRHNYHAALLHSCNNVSAILNTSLVEQYKATINHLQDDKEGHISTRHPGSFNKSDIKKTIKDLELRENQLIFIEVSSTGKINSFGHHYQYRWKYADTIKRQYGKDQDRDCLRSLATENMDNDKPPEQLSGGRLFFGYTKPKAEKDNTKNHNHHDRLAGRIAINMAIEQTDTPTDKQRFLDNGQAIALKELGSPKASAVEFYLNQQKNNKNDKLTTYGDISGTDTGGELNGRKYYWHQPSVKPNNYQHPSVEIENIENKRSPIARFVSDKNTEFRFTLRFRYLRPWELGLLLWVLNPEEALEMLPDYFDSDKIKSLYEKDMDSERDYKSVPLFAHKLGYARPLGFGSVSIEVDKILLWENNDLQIADHSTDWITAAAAKLKPNEEILESWLSLKRYRGRTIAEYPKGGRDNDTKGYHSQKRQDHAKARRKA